MFEQKDTPYSGETVGFRVSARNLWKHVITVKQKVES